MSEAVVIDASSDGKLLAELRGILVAGGHLDFDVVSVGDNSDLNQMLSEAANWVLHDYVFCVVSHKAIQVGRRAIEMLNSVAPHAPPIVVADQLSSDEIIELFRIGISDFVVTPLRESSLIPRLWRLKPVADCDEETVMCATSSEVEENSLECLGIVGRSESFLQEAKKISVYASCNAPVILLGETGTGKELFARAVHQLSSRSDQSFVAINCGALPLDLVENELFGHERGAYTGTAGASQGLIEEAEGGTLFLDEIDSLPALAQVKLLRVLQDGEYRRLGSTKLRKANVRIVAASNTDLDCAIQEGRMRSDLYYRLNTLPIYIPPLRERVEDIPLLVRHFCRLLSEKNGREETQLSSKAVQQLMWSDWPGNIRELAYVVERSILLGEESVLVEHAQRNGGGRLGRSFSGSFKEAKAACVAEFERRFLEEGLRAFQGNISKAARVAGKNRRAYWELIRKHEINVKRFIPGPC